MNEMLIFLDVFFAGKERNAGSSDDSGFTRQWLIPFGVSWHAILWDFELVL
jgi:hypothetical protein